MNLLTTIITSLGFWWTGTIWMRFELSHVSWVTAPAFECRFPLYWTTSVLSPALFAHFFHHCLPPISSCKPEGISLPRYSSSPKNFSWYHRQEHASCWGDYNTAGNILWDIVWPLELVTLLRLCNHDLGGVAVGEMFVFSLWSVIVPRNLMAVCHQDIRGEGLICGWKSSYPTNTISGLTEATTATTWPHSVLLVGHTYVSCKTLVSRYVDFLQHLAWECLVCICATWSRWSMLLV